jgi:hypothetical protein
MRVGNGPKMDEKHKQLSLFDERLFCYMRINDEKDTPICIIKYILALLVCYPFHTPSNKKVRVFLLLTPFYNVLIGRA